MFGRDEGLRLAAMAVEMAAPLECHALLSTERLELTRYAGNRIHQNVAEEDDILYVTVRDGRRSASGSGNRLDESSVRTLVREVSELAKLSPESDVIPPLPGPQEYPNVDPFASATALWTPQQRAEAIGMVVDQAQQYTLSASGSYFTSIAQTVLANSEGLSMCETRTAAGLTAVVTGGSLSGYGDGYARDAGHINPVDIGATAVAKATMYAEAVPVEPGEYEVVLEPNAVADLLAYLSYVGFGAQAVQEGRSFMSDRLGERVTGENVTIVEDPLVPEGYYSAVDAEGMPRTRVELIRGGRAVGPVYDLTTAAIEGCASTGHAVHPKDRQWSSEPQPVSLFMQNGEADPDEMIGSVRRGLLVTRFHYINVVNPSKTVLTGMTRDGTFLIENGQITHRVNDMRFVMSVLDAFNGIDMLGRERKLILGDSSAIMAPSLKLRRFTFVGRSDR